MNSHLEEHFRKVHSGMFLIERFRQTQSNLSNTVSTSPLSAGEQLSVTNFENADQREKNEWMGDLKSSYHVYLYGSLLCLLSRKDI